MAGVNITPGTIGGAFTNLIVFFPSLVVTTQNGGRISQAGYVGSGSTVPVNFYSDDGSATAISGNWLQLNLSEDRKFDPWSSGRRVEALGGCEPHVGTENFFVQDSGPVPSAPVAPAFVAYYDNDFNAGESGYDQSFVRYSADWGINSSQPLAGVVDFGSVKEYPANQINWDVLVPVSSFSKIMGYANVVNPMKPASANTNIIYEAAWDIYGVAHTDRSGISLEVMFWTYNHNQNPGIGPLVETGIDLNGDGLLWDLYMTADTAATGGVNSQYSYCIWYLQEQFQGDAQWVNILAGLQYVLEYYVVPSGPSAPARGLSVPIFQITRGWEVCSTNYTPLNFRMHDYRVVME
jgi:hypothetical protein